MYPKQELAKKIEEATTCLPQGIAPPKGKLMTTIKEHYF
jgi:hypothetical protein